MQIQTHTYMQVYKYIQTTYVRRYTHTQSTQLQVLGDDYEYPDKFKEHIYSYNYYLDAHEQTSILDTNVRWWTKCVGPCIVGVALVNPVGIPLSLYPLLSKHNLDKFLVFPRLNIYSVFNFFGPTLHRPLYYFANTQIPSWTITQIDHSQFSIFLY